MELDLKTVISVVALVVSVISAGFSIGFGYFDRFPRIKTRCTYLPPTQELEGPGTPPLLMIEIANHGRKDIYLEYLYIQYESGRSIHYAETNWEEDIRGRYRLFEGDSYSQAFDPDSDSILRASEAGEATKIFFQDSLGRRYFPRHARASIKAYLEAARDF